MQCKHMQFLQFDHCSDELDMKNILRFRSHADKCSIPTNTVVELFFKLTQNCTKVFSETFQHGRGLTHLLCNA